MICKLCGEDKKLIRSHILPKSFFQNVYKKNEGVEISAKSNEHPKRRPIGIYENILCKECERIFSTWDNYGNKFFSSILSSPSSRINNIANIYQDINYKELKLFIISLLWRMAICEDDFFREIQLGSFEEKLKNLICTSNPSDANDFSVMIWKFNISNNQILHPPQKIKLANLNGYILYFFNSAVFIKVDSRSLRLYKTLIFSPKQPLIVGLKSPPEIIKKINNFSAF